MSINTFIERRLHLVNGYSTIIRVNEEVVITQVYPEYVRLTFNGGAVRLEVALDKFTADNVSQLVSI